MCSYIYIYIYIWSLYETVHGYLILWECFEVKLINDGYVTF